MTKRNTNKVTPVADDPTDISEDELEYMLETADLDGPDDEPEADTEPTFSPKDLAKELGIDAKAFRRWLRANTPQRANKGGRWVFTTESKAALITLYNKRSSKGTDADLELETID